MNLSADQITIAVTVYNRREFLKESIGSALAQTVPVQVMVVEDCGPDAGLEAYVRSLFGGRVKYFRSPQRRGIFGNWNACIEQCPNAWLSILHDDDSLEPGFVAAMLELSRNAGDRGLYFGRTTVVDSNNKPQSKWEKPRLPRPWMPVSLADVVITPPFFFPGQLFRVAKARQLGGFRQTSLYCGEWELWTKIIADCGAAQTDLRVAVFREHDSWGRGTNRIHRSGKTYGLVAVQIKRNLALARRLGISGFDGNLRERARFALPTSFLLHYGSFFSPRLLAYNLGRVRQSRPPHWRYAVLRAFLFVGGPVFVRLASRLWLLVNAREQGEPTGKRP
jgi:glycosyltransferase involved in cell wall biosynthesis